MLKKGQYEEFFEKHHVVDAVVRDQSQFYFVLKKIDRSQSDEDIYRVRIVKVTFDDDGLSLAKSGLSGYDEDSIYCEMTYPEERVLVVDSSAIYFHGSKRSQPAIPSRYEGGPIGGAIRRVRPIGRSPAMVVTSAGDLVIRHDEDETWTRVGPELSEEHPLSAGIEDFDGFALDDIYAGGEEGLFHYDGASWTKMPQPKRLVSSVCCAPDGFVYAATWLPGRVAIYKGRGETWEKLYEDRNRESYANPYRDLVWHDGILWAASWSELLALKDGEREYPSGSPSGGHLSARDGVLLCAQERSVSWHKENKEWQTLFEGWTWD